MGIDGINGVIADMVEIGVLDPLSVKIQTIKTAVESACMLLRIDDVVSGMADNSDKSKQSTNFEDNEDATVQIFHVKLFYWFSCLVWRCT